MALTKRQRLFVQEYLIDFNATQAAIRAGYSKKTAYSQGQRLLKHVEVKAAIEAAIKKREKRLEVTQDRVIKELAKLAFADIKDYLAFRTEKTVVAYDEGQPIYSYNHVIDMKPSDQVDGAVVSEVSLKDGALRFKLHDKKGALELLGRHLKLFTDKFEHADRDGGPIEVKKYDQLSDEELDRLLVEKLTTLGKAEVTEPDCTVIILLPETISIVEAANKLCSHFSCIWHITTP